MPHSVSDSHTTMLSEQLLHDVADLFETRKKLAERKTQDLITHQWNEQLGNEIPQEYIDFCKAWVKVQLQVNNNPEVAKKNRQEILAPFSDWPSTWTAGFSRIWFEREISYPDSEVEQILLHWTLHNLATVSAYIDSLPAPLVWRFNEYMRYKAYTPATSYWVAYQSAIRLFRSLQNYITHTPKAKRILSASKANLQTTLDLPNFSTLTSKEQALILQKIQKALISPWSHKKIYACVTLYQELLENTRNNTTPETMHTAQILPNETKPVSKQGVNSIISYIKNHKLALWWALLLILYIIFADTLNKQIEEKTIITTHLPKQKPWLTWFPDQETYDTSYELFADSIQNTATQRWLSMKNIATIDHMIDGLDASFDTLLTQTKRLEDKRVYTNKWYSETLSKKDSIQFRNYIATLKEQSRQINKVLNSRTEIDRINSYADFLQKSQLITDWIVACVTNDPNSASKLRQLKHPIAIDRKLWTKKTLHVLLHELHHSIAPAHKYHSITEWTTEHCTQLAIEQTLWSPLTHATYTEEVVNAVLLQHAFNDPAIKQINAFTGKQIIPWGTSFSPELLKKIHTSSREQIRKKYQWIEDKQQKKEMYDAIRYSRLKNYLNTTTYTHPLLVVLMLPQEQINRSERTLLPKDGIFQQETPYNKTLETYWIQPRSCSSHFRWWLYEVVQSHAIINTQWRTFTIDEFQSLDLKTQKQLFASLQQSYIRFPDSRTAWYNVTPDAHHHDWSTRAQEANHIDDETEAAYDKLQDTIHELSETIQISVFLLVLLFMIACYGSWKRQDKTYKNTYKILHTERFIKQMLSKYITLLESYEWTDLFHTHEVIQIAQHDIRKALPKKREKNIFLWFPVLYQWSSVDSHNYQQVAYYSALFKTLSALPHQSYHNINGIWYDYLLQEQQKKTANKKK